MKLLTSKKTLLVGALSLISSASAVVMSSTQDLNVLAFLQNNAGTEIAASSQQVNEEKSYILQGLGADALVAAVQKVGGMVSREFPIINAISALLTHSQVSELGSYANLRVTEDRSVTTSSVGTGKFSVDNYIAKQTNASMLHDMDITGDGVTVAVLDSGTMLEGNSEYLLNNKSGKSRKFIKYDTESGRKTKVLNDDENGHGTHISNIIASSMQDENGRFNGIAPDINLLSVKAFDANGNSSYSEVLDGLNWIYKNIGKYKIKVLNLSLGAEVQSTYWNDPINQAVMRLWKKGVVVVTSAGNSGSEYGTVSVPGNNPYVITVGAATDNYTPYDYSDDRVTSFSARGPTFEGFVKPEIIAYGARIKQKFSGVVAANNFTSAEDAQDYYSASGTSQAAAVITGTVALMLQMDKNASPDDIKCRLMATANAGFDSNATANPFVQGAGLVDSYQAAMSTATGCANAGLDIDAELEGLVHFMGPARADANGELYLELNTGAVLSESTGWGMTAESTGWGMTAESTGWGMTAESTGWGVFNESTGWGVNAESTGWGVNAESTGWGVLMESTGWGVLMESTGWGVIMESTGWGVNAESTGWGVNAESTGWGVTIESVDGTVTQTVALPGEDFIWEDTILPGEDLEFDDVDSEPDTAVIKSVLGI